MQRIVVVKVLHEPIVDDPFTDRFFTPNEEEIRQSLHQLCLLSQYGCREDRLLLVGPDEGAPLEEHDQVANHEVFLSIEGRPVEDSHDRLLVKVVLGAAQVTSLLSTQDHFVLTGFVGPLHLGQQLGLIDNRLGHSFV